jgi:hypothetical protein
MREARIYERSQVKVGKEKEGLHSEGQGINRLEYERRVMLYQLCIYWQAYCMAAVASVVVNLFCF